jgi:hypothetical protein
MKKVFAVAAILFVSFLAFRLIQQSREHAAFLADPVQVQEANEAHDFWLLACERSKARGIRCDGRFKCPVQC